ncbi:MAG: hypothetical protein RL367_2769, partial [Pseudomonadota bacterium]
MTIITIRPVVTKADKKAFVDLQYRLYAGDPAFVPPLRFEAEALITPGKNPWFTHGEAQLYLAERDGSVVGRISAHIDHLALAQPVEQGMGPGTGNWGLLEAEDQAAAHGLIAQAESWLRGKGMHRVLGPLSISIWDMPGVLVKGFDHSPTVMMGHNSPAQQGWIESAGYTFVKSLKCWDLDITGEFPPLVQRIVQSGERNPRIRIRMADKSRFDQECRLILSILNDAWSDNWGFVPMNEAEVDYIGKNLKTLVFKELVRIAEVEGEPVAFLVTLPDLNETIKPM